jgi:hypothetical protein
MRGPLGLNDEDNASLRWFGECYKADTWAWRAGDLVDVFRISDAIPLRNRRRTASSMHSQAAQSLIRRMKPCGPCVNVSVVALTPHLLLHDGDGCRLRTS